MPLAQVYAAEIESIKIGYKELERFHLLDYPERYF